MSVSREPQTLEEWKAAYFVALNRDRWTVDEHGNCSRCGGIHYGTGRVCVYANEPTTLNKWLVEMTQERDTLQRRVEALESLYDAALAFCHSIEAQLKHGRASSKAIKLEQAVRQVAALRGGGTG